MEQKEKTPHKPQKKKGLIKQKLNGHLPRHHKKVKKKTKTPENLSTKGATNTKTHCSSLALFYIHHSIPSRLIRE
jgi:hypothetical protein